jgi:sec-independent protein translocase protein TatA
MFGELGVPELLVILVIVLVLFGGSRLTEIMAAMGKGVREFRKAVKEDEPRPGEGKTSS